MSRARDLANRTIANAALPKAGGTMTGNIVMGDDTSIGIADDAERIEFDGAGDISVLGANFGIGTSAPDSLMELSASGQASLKVTSTGGTGADILLERGTGSSGSRGIHSEGGKLILSASGDSFASRADQVIVDYSGNVGIGTTAPATVLSASYVMGTETAPVGVLTLEGVDTPGGADIGGGAGPTIDFRIPTSTSVTKVSSRIGAIKQSTSDNNDASHLVFYTSNNAAAATEKMRIDREGNVGIGQTSPTGGITTAVCLHVGNSSHANSGFAMQDNETTWTFECNGNLNLNSASTNRMSIRADNGVMTITAGTVTSDERLKENIVTIPDALTKINNLIGRKFNWIDEANTGSETSYGLIAQEVESVVPEVVNSYGLYNIKKSDGTITTDEIGDDVESSKSLNMTGIIPILVEAVKELSAKVTALENA